MMSDGNVPKALQQSVDRELESGERVQWMEMPMAKFFTPTALLGVLIGIPWTVFSVSWTAIAANGIDFSAGPSMAMAFPMFGVPFILVGLVLLLSPLWAYHKRRSTVYVVTDRRAITFDGGWSTTVRSYAPANLQDIYRKEKRDGSGDVIIARRAWRDSDGDRGSEELGFLGVKNPKDVEEMLRQLSRYGSLTK